MKTTEFLLILTGVLLNAGAQLLLKAGTRAVGTFDFSGRALLTAGCQIAAQPAILAGLACYGVSVVVWIMALSRVEVSIAYPMLSIGYVVNALAAWWLFGEMLTAPRLVGIFIIVIGVALVARS